MDLSLLPFSVDTEDGFLIGFIFRGTDRKDKFKQRLIR